MSNGEPLPWETPEYLAKYPNVNSEDSIVNPIVNLDTNSTPDSFNCGNSECKNKVATPSFCSEECRKAYWGERKPGEQRKWTLEEAQAWCKERAEEARQKRLSLLPPEQISMQ